MIRPERIPCLFSVGFCPSGIVGKEGLSFKGSGTCNHAFAER